MPVFSFHSQKYSFSTKLFNANRIAFNCSIFFVLHLQLHIFPISTQFAFLPYEQLLRYLELARSNHTVYCQRTALSNLRYQDTITILLRLPMLHNPYYTCVHIPSLIHLVKSAALVILFLARTHQYTNHTFR